MITHKKFEALVVSQSVGVLNDLLAIMEELPIDVNVCMTQSRATDLLYQRDFDLLVIDCAQANGAERLARKSRTSTGRRKMLIAALANSPAPWRDLSNAGADVLINKPLTACSANDFHDLVYSRMVKEWRREPRYAVDWLVAAMDSRDRPVPLAMTNISEGGIALSYTGNVRVDDALKFQLLLPGTNQVIRFDARILWTAHDNMAGAEITSIAASESGILRAWLQEKRQGKPGTAESLCYSQLQ
jgi:hypothetical protein